MISKETIKQALERAASAFVTGAIGAFVVIPVNLNEPKKYLLVLFVGMITGGLMGLQKLYRGYVNYDKV